MNYERCKTLRSQLREKADGTRTTRMERIKTDFPLLLIRFNQPNQRYLRNLLSKSNRNS